ncbi:hypothetical protein SAMN05444392_11138 [Seinonella peptonophila]|uniref:Uncharacterized protein n=1 Tax=Seinonella peptonophila TaxID=112248 RepID=A0A1M4ZXS0_9BACL|nr:hypothetical protein [Seinonella peptonophila]SHF22840.1 hypothetical protein SAMN05444392_11138 [Seinonella peptonophila]
MINSMLAKQALSIRQLKKQLEKENKEGCPFYNKVGNLACKDGSCYPKEEAVEKM